MEPTPKTALAMGLVAVSPGMSVSASRFDDPVYGAVFLPCWNAKPSGRDRMVLIHLCIHNAQPRAWRRWGLRKAQKWKE